MAVLIKSGDGAQSMETAESIGANANKVTTSASNLFSAIVGLKASTSLKEEEEGKRKFKSTAGRIILKRKLNENKANEFRNFNVDELPSSESNPGNTNNFEKQISPFKRGTVGFARDFQVSRGIFLSFHLIILVWSFSCHL